jgi:hypothetical protein
MHAVGLRGQVRKFTLCRGGGGVALDVLPWQRTRTQQCKARLFSLPSVLRQQWMCFLRVRSQEVFSTGLISGYISRVVAEATACLPLTEEEAHCLIA